eukprot:3729928-Pleurochrysis_carterae.AAC.2
MTELQHCPCRTHVPTTAQPDSPSRLQSVKYESPSLLSTRACRNSNAASLSTVKGESSLPRFQEASRRREGRSTPQLRSTNKARDLARTTTTP